MQIIKDKRIVDDMWQAIDDESPLPIGDVSLSFARWQKEKHQLKHRTGKLGIRLHPADDVNELADDVKRLELIVLDFADFADGRSFSQAWLLRERFGFQGELRASGHYMPDQALYLMRVGVNAFCPEKFGDMPIILAKMNEISVNYQKSVA
jgi:uncharacterized protein (DUF934 family)